MKLKNFEVKYPYTEIGYTSNVSNSPARRFYERHGAEKISQAFEISDRDGSEDLMTTHMCLKYEAGQCPRHEGRGGDYIEPFILADGCRSFQLSFDCARCVMVVKNS